MWGSLVFDNCDTATRKKGTTRWDYHPTGTPINYAFFKESEHSDIPFATVTLENSIFNHE